MSSPQLLDQTLLHRGLRQATQGSRGRSVLIIKQAVRLTAHVGLEPQHFKSKFYWSMP